MRFFDRSQLGRVLLLLSLVLGAMLPVPVQAQEATDTAAIADDVTAPLWLEPRGLSVLDMVGQVPEDHLRGSILVFDEAGVTRYLRGERQGDTVTIEVSMSSYENPFHTEFPCLGRRAIFDEWPVAVPPSEMRIYSAGVDITNQVRPSLWYFPAAQDEPIRSSRPGGGPAERYYEELQAQTAHTPSGAIATPANMGCTYFLVGSVPDLTATFVFDYPQQVYVEPLDSTTLTFHSYIGPGEAGRMDKLSQQLRGSYGDRHDKFPVNAPPGADYVWLNFPPSPVSPYAAESSKLEHNIRLPSAGTYRLIGHGDQKSVDHVVSMGLPLSSQWFDADLDSGDWLERISPIELISAPEYFVPPGVPYDPCMKDGGCDGELLDTIYRTEAEMTLHYYRVRRLRSSNLMRVPLRQVGPSWGPDAYLEADVVPMPPAAAQDAASDADAPETVVLPFLRLLLPLVHFTLVPPTFPDNPPQEGCPCGWFDPYFRMLDVSPAWRSNRRNSVRADADWLGLCVPYVPAA